MMSVAFLPLSLQAILLKYTTHLRCRLTKNSPRRTTSTPAGVFCTLLASASSISKGLRYKTFQNGHRRPWFYTATCLRCKHVGKKCTGMYIFYRASALFLFAPCIRYHYFQKAYGRGLQEMRLLKILNVSERTGMSVVPCSSEFSHTTKLGAQECTGRTFLGVPAVNLCSRLVSTSSISKGLRKGFTGDAATEINTQRIRTDRDVRGSKQQ